ncbi:hypothetical protein SynWH8101_0630 [Synechococcus sp. WH 8101]|uniref:phage integrase SAM-like domain-containing protein n=1 Tax=Synechococcus sp. WH 8101 TaxID=59932 RepID=UPI001024103F|nr:phage integrase SAM-like domain-containing protein [Synechococcus sp. WH 8101]QBE68225.1 hypothetical protein SynWH8101_0630 [Synechococcus sp. WH 8101]
MPKIIFKELTLNDQAYIIKYNHRDTFYLRIKRDGKRYTNVSLKTKDLNVAKQNALATYLQIASEPPKSRTRRFGFVAACDEFLDEKEKEVSRKQLSLRSHNTYCQRIRQRIIPFAKFVGVKNIGDIDKKTFEGYRTYYLDIQTKGKWKTATSGLAPSTINSDISTLREFLNWCVEKEYLDPRKIGLIKKAIDNTDYREDSNPAFFPDEFARMKDELYKFDTNCKDEEEEWKKRWFINYILFQYHLGSRPHETAKIRCGNCRVEKRPDNKLKGIVEIPADTKRGKRTAIMNGHTLKRIQDHLRKGIKIRNQQIEKYNQFIKDELSLEELGVDDDISTSAKPNARYYDKDGKIDLVKVKKRFPRINLKTLQYDFLDPVSNDDLLMMNPFLVGRKMYHAEHIRTWWKEIMSKCRFDKNYTLYSLRSTHITHMLLLEGARIKEVADNCGTSQAEIERTYRRLNNLLNIDKLGFHQDNKFVFQDKQGREIIFKPEMDDGSFDYLR